MNLRTAMPALLAVSLTVVASPAIGADDALYKQHVEKAREMVRKGDRRAAIREFDTAYSISPKPEALFNMGVVYKNLAAAAKSREDALRSIDQFSLYLERYRALNSTDAPDRNTVERYIEELRREYGIAASQPAAPAMAIPPSPPAPAAVRPSTPATPTPAQAPAVPVAATGSVGVQSGPALLASNANESPTQGGAAEAQEKSTASTPLVKRWWLWTAIGAVVVAGVGVGLGVGLGTSGAQAPIPSTGNGNFGVTFP